MSHTDTIQLESWRTINNVLQNEGNGNTFRLDQPMLPIIDVAAYFVDKFINLIHANISSGIACWTEDNDSLNHLQQAMYRLRESILQHPDLNTVRTYATVAFNAKCIACLEKIFSTVTGHLNMRDHKHQPDENQSTTSQMSKYILPMLTELKNDVSDTFKSFELEFTQAIKDGLLDRPSENILINIDMMVEESWCQFYQRYVCTAMPEELGMSY
jgi:hypothetical protein